MTDIELAKQDIQDELADMKDDPPDPDEPELCHWVDGYCAGLRFALWVLNGAPHGN